MDIIAALQWVKENIAGFGGNPTNVSAAGHSAGATAILCLLCMPPAQGTFQRAILHSPTAFTLTPSAALRYDYAQLERLQFLPAGTLQLGHAPAYYNMRV